MSKSPPPKILPSKRPGRFLTRYSEADLPTARGTFHAIVFRDRRDGTEHVALVMGEVEGGAIENGVAGLDGAPWR